MTPSDPEPPAPGLDGVLERLASSERHGISVLFAGESGTGKTLAADALAEELGSPLQRVDLSAVVSKHIGETEKNLRRVFDAAAAEGTVLLFDEADALFGKRTVNAGATYLLDRAAQHPTVSIVSVAAAPDAVHPDVRRRFATVVDFSPPAPA